MASQSLALAQHLSFPALSSERARDMEVEHFSHPDHPLILINQVLEYSCELVICSGCEGPIWGPCYSCTSCYFFLHKTCAELPREIKRRIHPRHPLHLLAKPPYKGEYSCNFFLDKTCIELPRRKKWQYHQNQLILSWNRWEHDLYNCVVCNQYFRGLRHTCDVCGLCIDVRCFKSLKDFTKHGVILTR